MATLLKDMRINPRALGRGDAATVEQLADLRHLDAAQREALRRYTPWRALGDEAATVAGNRLMPRSVTSSSVRICPHCVAEDLDAFEGRMIARPWLRLEWIISHVRSCGRHGNLLLDIASVHPTHRTFDFSQTVAHEILPVLDRLRAEAVLGPGAAYRDWFVARLDGVRDPGNWLDDMPLHAAAAFCEMLGLSARHPAGIAVYKLGHQEWALAAEEGYRAASLGKAGIDPLLDRMVAERKYRRGILGHEKAYAHVYVFLRRSGDDPDFEKPRAVLRDHAFATLPFNPGRTVLGATLQARKVHTLRTAALTVSRSDVGLRRILAASALTKPDALGRLKVPLPEFEVLAASLAEHLTTKDVASLTGFDRRLVEDLAETGMLPSLPADRRPAGANHRFMRGDVRALMARLFRDAQTVPAPHGRRVPVVQARNKTRGHASDILSLILGERLAWVGRTGDTDRYENLLVDIDEVVAVMRSGASMKGVYATEAAELLPGVRKEGMRHLADAGHLVETTEFCPRSMRRMKVYTRESIEAFAAEYVSLNAVAQAHGIYHASAAHRLRKAGVNAAFDTGNVGSVIFRRRDVDASGAFADVSGGPDN